MIMNNTIKADLIRIKNIRVDLENATSKKERYYLDLRLKNLSRLIYN